MRHGPTLASRGRLGLHAHVAAHPFRRLRPADASPAPVPQRSGCRRIDPDGLGLRPDWSFAQRRGRLGQQPESGGDHGTRTLLSITPSGRLAGAYSRTDLGCAGSAGNVRSADPRGGCDGNQRTRRAAVEWRAHVLISAVTGTIRSVQFTGDEGGEKLSRYVVQEGEVILGDRAY